MWAEVAWQEVSEETIENCWRHAGILPHHQQALGVAAVITPGLEDLQTALTQLCASEKGHCLSLMEAGEFVDLGDGAAGFDVSLDEIFDLVTAYNTNNEQSTELLENDSDESDATEETEEALSLIEIYQGLLGVERFWRDNASNAAFHLTKDIRTLLCNTRSFLQ